MRRGCRPLQLPASWSLSRNETDADTGVAGAASGPACCAVHVCGTACRRRALAVQQLIVPIKGVARAALRDTYHETRPHGPHEALDIHAPRGTPVVAVGDGTIVKLFRSVFGGITVYQFDPERRFVYYYAHLDRYAEGLREGQAIMRGDVIGYVGSTGNAAADAPHLHFAIFLLGPEKAWWRGNPGQPASVPARPTPAVSCGSPQFGGFAPTAVYRSASGTTRPCSGSIRSIGSFEVWPGCRPGSCCSGSPAPAAASSADPA